MATFIKLFAIKIVARSAFGLSSNFKIRLDTEEFSFFKNSFWVFDILNRATSDPDSKADKPTIKNITKRINPVWKLKGKKIEALLVIKR